MPSGIPTRLHLTKALVTLVSTATGKPSKASRAPNKGQDILVTADMPYTIIYPVAGGGQDEGAPLVYPDEMTTYVYQVTSFGLREDQAEWMADKVRVALLGRATTGAFQQALSVDNLSILNRWATGPPGGVAQDDRIFYIADSYSFRVQAL